jgi:hypothetical protein
MWKCRVSTSVCSKKFTSPSPVASTSLLRQNASTLFVDAAVIDTISPPGMSLDAPQPFISLNYKLNIVYSSCLVQSAHDV